MFTKKFLKDLAERAIKTFAQTLAALLTAVVLAGGQVGDVQWMAALSVAVLATIYSALTSIGSAQVGDKDSASLVK